MLNCSCAPKSCAATPLDGGAPMRPSLKGVFEFVPGCDWCSCSPKSASTGGMLSRSKSPMLNMFDNSSNSFAICAIASISPLGCDQACSVVVFMSGQDRFASRSESILLTRHSMSLQRSLKYRCLAVISYIEGRRWQRAPTEGHQEPFLC